MVLVRHRRPVIRADVVGRRPEREVRGLGLPDAVLRRFCHDNAVAWYPGLA